MQEQIIIGRFQSILSGYIPKAVIAFMVALIAPVAPAMIVLFVLMGIDLAIGVARAVKENRFSSARLRTGAFKFILYFTAVMVVRLAEQQIFNTTGKSISYAAGFMILYFSLTEVISILESLVKLGLDIPSLVINYLKKQIEIQKLPGK